MSPQNVSQSGSASKNLTQVGRDYIKYISYNISAGNWGVVVLNGLVIAFIVLGLGTTAKAAHNTTRNMIFEDKLVGNAEGGICTPEIAMLNVQIARQIQEMSQGGQLTAAVISDLPELKALQGPAGPRGAQGAGGLKGEAGERGPQGPQGKTGERGIQGEKGEVGTKGERGLKGEAGERGLQGGQGKTGERGIQGEKGEVGERGPAGAQGEPADDWFGRAHSSRVQSQH